MADNQEQQFGEEFGFSIPVPNVKSNRIINKLKAGKPVQLSYKQLTENPKNVFINLGDAMRRKLMRSIREGRGSRLILEIPEERASINSPDFIFTQGGRISFKKSKVKKNIKELKSMSNDIIKVKMPRGRKMKPAVMPPMEGMKLAVMPPMDEGGKIKSLKEIGRDIKKSNKKVGEAFKKVGEELKTVPKYYRKNIRQYTQPIAKVLIKEGIPQIGSLLVEEGMKALDVPAPVAKLAGKATKKGLEKPADMAFRKSGLGLKSDMKKVARASKKGVKSAMDYLGSGMDEDIGYGVKPLMGRMPRNAGMGLRVKDAYYPNEIDGYPIAIHFGGAVPMGRLIDTQHGAYTPYITASTPMLPMGTGLYAGRMGYGLYA